MRKRLREDEPKKGWRPPLPYRHTTSLSHWTQYGVPDVGFDIGAHVLIEAPSRTTFVAANFHRLTESHVVSKTPFIFVLHIVEDWEVFGVKLLTAVLVVLWDAGVLPFLFSHRFTMLFPPFFIRTTCLAYVDWFSGARTFVFVNAFFFLLYPSLSFPLALIPASDDEI